MINHVGNPMKKTALERRLQLTLTTPDNSSNSNTSYAQYDLEEARNKKFVYPNGKGIYFFGYVAYFPYILTLPTTLFYLNFVD